MKYNNFFIALALCAAMQPGISFGMENSIAEEIAQEQKQESMAAQVPQGQSYWQRYAPQFMQNTYDMVASWSRTKKLVVAGAIITALAAIYNRDQIMQWVGDILQKNSENLRESLFIQFKEKTATMTKLLREETRLSNIKNPTEADKNLLLGVFKQINQLQKKGRLIENQLKNLGMSDIDLYEAALDVVID